jgi:uncharacterized protein YecE (DUF72 family)
VPGVIRIGCSGWQYRHWRGSFYPSDLPASRWLEHYATLFETVEINNTYTDTRLRAWAEWLAAHAAERRDGYVHFNNDVGGHAPRDACRLRAMVDRHG